MNRLTEGWAKRVDELLALSQNSGGGGGSATPQ